MTITTLPAAAYLDERIGEKVREVQALKDLIAGLRDGSRTWRDHCPEMKLPHWSEELTDLIAREECLAALDIAKAELESLKRQAGVA